jgi:predicted transcriptional regulator
MNRKRASDKGDFLAPPQPLPNGNYPVEAMRIGLVRRLIRDRRAVGLTQVELARRAGIAAESLNRIEKGRLTPTMATMHKIDRALEAAEKAQSKLDAKSN